MKNFLNITLLSTTILCSAAVNAEIAPFALQNTSAYFMTLRVVEVANSENEQNIFHEIILEKNSTVFSDDLPFTLKDTSSRLEVQEVAITNKDQTSVVVIDFAEGTTPSGYCNLALSNASGGYNLIHLNVDIGNAQNLIFFCDSGDDKTWKSAQ